MKGRWTIPGTLTPSSHLLDVRWLRLGWRTRCGRLVPIPSDASPEPPANAKTCERCLVLSSRDA